MPPWVILSLLHYAFALLQPSRITGAFVGGTAAVRRDWRKRSFTAAKPVALGSCLDPSSSTPSPLPPYVGSNALPARGSKALGGGWSVLAHAWPWWTPGTRWVAATWMLQGLKQPVLLLTTAPRGTGAPLYLPFHM